MNFENNRGRLNRQYSLMNLIVAILAILLVGSGFACAKDIQKGNFESKHGALTLSNGAAEDDRYWSLERKFDIAEKEIDLQQQTTETYKDQASFSFLVIEVLLALVGLFIPIFVYFTTLRPAAKISEEAKKTLEGLDSKFEELSEKRFQQTIEQAIIRLGNENSDVRRRAVTHLTINAYRGFSEKQIFDICHATRKIDDAEKAGLLGMLGTINSPYVMQLAMTLLQAGGEQDFSNFVYTQCKFLEYKELREAVRRCVLTRANRNFSSEQAFFNSCRSAPEFFKEIINDRDLLGSISLEIRFHIINVLNFKNNRFEAWEEFKAESLLLRSIEGRRIALKGTGGREFKSDDDPDTAELAILFVDGQQGDAQSKYNPGFSSLVAEYKAGRQSWNLG